MLKDFITSSEYAKASVFPRLYTVSMGEPEYIFVHMDHKARDLGCLSESDILVKSILSLHEELGEELQSRMLVCQG